MLRGVGVRELFFRDQKGHRLADRECLWLLQQAVRPVNVRARPIDQPWMARATAALAVDPAVVRTLTDYSTHGADLLAVRREIAKLLAEQR